MYIRIDRRRKLPATILLRALGYSTTRRCLSTFFNNDEFKPSALKEIRMPSWRPCAERLRGEAAQLRYHRARAAR